MSTRKLPDPSAAEKRPACDEPRNNGGQRAVRKSVADYEREILGKAPANLPKVTWEVVKTTPEKYGDFDVITKRLVGHVDNSIDPKIQVNIEMVLITPAHAAGPVPVIGWSWPSTQTFRTQLQRQYAEVGAPGHGHYGVEWEPLLKRGWGFAVLSPTSFQADDGVGSHRAASSD